MRTKFISALGLILLLASCVEDNFNDINNITPTPGQDIVFSANINTPKTRTVYGVEVDSDNDNTNDQVKVKWVHGDLVTVYGTACAAGRQQADYAVQSFVKDEAGNPTTEVAPSTPNTDDGYSYADDLVKSGAYGVQWGKSTTSDFYAVYPAVEDGAFKAIVDENNVVTGVTVASKINAQQYLSFTSGTTAVTGIPYNSTGKAYGMNDALMYAYTPNATPTDEKVDLNFRPFSTVLNFSIPSWEAETNSGLKTEGSSIIVNSIELTAPYGIAGDFDLQIKNNGTASAGEGSSKTITIYPAGQLKWDFGKSLEFSVFTIPVNGKNMGEWTVSIELANQDENGLYITKKFKFSQTNADTGVNTSALSAGMIHKINVSSAFAVDAVWNYSPENWLTTVPRNVYISDLSLPGAWYATNPDYQSTTDLSVQYSKGIRAFNIDCRLTYKSGRSGDMDLYCAGTEGSFLGKITSEGTTVLSALQTISNQIKYNEYVVVVLTIAEKCKSDSSRDLGTVDPEEVLNAIYNVLKNNGSSLKVYGYTDESKDKVVNANTTVNDVLDHMIVKVNVNTVATKTILGEGDAAVEIPGFTTYTNLPNTLLSYASMAPETSNPIVIGVYDRMQNAPMYWGTEDASLTFYYHQAQRTTYSGTYEDTNWLGQTQIKSYEVSGVPTYEARMKAIDDIIATSRQIYASNQHNAWFQIGIGGSRKNSNDSDAASSRNEIMQRLNPYLYGKIVSKSQNDVAPVGIVLMNYCTDTDKYSVTVDGKSHSASSIDLVNAIIELNGKYYLNRDTTQEAWPTDGSGTGNGTLVE